MGRKLLNVWPTITVEPSPSRSSVRQSWDAERAGQSADEFMALVKRHVLPHFTDHVDIHVDFEREFRCEHCNAQWTEDSPTYNGGCCAKDMEADSEPEAA